MSGSSNYRPPWSLLLGAKAFRTAASLGIGTQNYLSSNGSSESRVEWIDSTLGVKQAKNVIRLDIYNRPSSIFTSSSTREGQGNLRPGLIIFHGGGFVIGSGSDDIFFAQQSIDQLDTVAIGVSYRLAPENPFPIPVEGCVSAIIHKYNHAEKYGIDKHELIVAGFSAGGNLALSAQHILNTLSPDTTTSTIAGAENGYTIPEGMEIPKIRGLILIYPSLNWTISREEKTRNLPDPNQALPQSMTRLFDLSYFPKELGYDRSDYRLSPGIAPDELLKKLPPVCITVCEYDMLRAEGMDFVDRLQKMGKDVEWNEIKGEKHGWDKPPPLYPKESVGREYTRIFGVAKNWLE
ncbi:hypothetical protein L486_05257 [Kwoniella mangroviensis CBS 10435]|uniref:Alpha/beta hydrolase fold-3 domain-containing protein n=1 Tax=Kwoniella mangroviensis CBS 10435 TaxID=1331196 RepID=A0A1B9IQI1_9TREE|nr:hypothetical protein L486_05257 [Kwoniella mangroviensis CBS 10435]